MKVSSKFDVRFSVPFVHRVRFTRDLAGDEFDVLQEVLHREHGPARVLLVADQDVLDASDSAGEIARRLSVADGIDLVRGEADVSAPWGCVMPGGESVKNSEGPIRAVLDQIDRHGLDRRSYVVVVGGGAVLDAAGFSAALAHRGIRLIRLPTTTLAQADSGVGVKNAINYFGKKNWIGTFAVPWAVINDLGLLKSLPDRDFRCGFSEAVKVSLLKSADDFDFLCENAEAIHRRDDRVSFDAIERSCLWHLRHITEGGDPFEMLEARPLDFGHWSAHRMEALTRYEIRHGEAVGIGVIIDCIYSSAKHGLAPDDAVRVFRCMRDLGLPTWHPVLERVDELVSGLEEFRQHLGGRLTVTMLEGPGQPINVHEVDFALMHECIGRLRKWNREVDG